MGQMQVGYGSEFHLLRYLGRHRNKMDTAILDVLGTKKGSINWFDFSFLPKDKKGIYDAEFVGIDFLRSSDRFTHIKERWEKAWPSKQYAMNWDAIGRTSEGEWLLVEAKAHLAELISDSKAGEESLEKIEKRFKKVKDYFSVTTTSDWTKRYYQKANRLLFLHFLLNQGIPCKLIFIYFLNGYERKDDDRSIRSIQEWKRILEEQDIYLGIEKNPIVKAHSVSVFLDARGG